MGRAGALSAEASAEADCLLPQSNQAERLRALRLRVCAAPRLRAAIPVEGSRLHDQLRDAADEVVELSKTDAEAMQQ